VAFRGSTKEAVALDFSRDVYPIRFQFLLILTVLSPGTAPETVKPVSSVRYTKYPV
jgi:hypothetical protein